MAPRRKVGLKRMDAAIDALVPMGFPPELIRQKVKELLKVYEGDEGWVFIEEAYYKLLIELFWRTKRESNKGNLLDLSNDIRDEAGLEVEPLEAGPSGTANEPLCSNKDAALLGPITVLEPAPLPLAETLVSPSDNGSIYEFPEVNQIHDATGVQEEIAGLTDACMDTALPGFEYLPLPQAFATRKRKPCLGWIGPKDDEDFVLLKPAPIQSQKVHQRRRKHKSRWDLTPNDPL